MLKSPNSLPPTITDVPREPSSKSNINNKQEGVDHPCFSCSLSLVELYSHDKSMLKRWFIEGEKVEFGKRIGSGSWSVVYKGSYQGQEVAIKVLRGCKVRGCRAMQSILKREVLSLSMCSNHKNVLKLYGVCYKARHGVCIVTQFMEGGSLQDYLQKQVPKLKLEEALRIAIDIAKGMEVLHSRGIVHMDLKSTNIFLDSKRRAVIGDFGLSHSLMLNGSSTCSEGSREDLGSYKWMAPEVCASNIYDDNDSKVGSISTKSDIYSFGILLWELITCKLPYEDYNPVQAAAAVVMHGLRPTIPTHCFPPLKCILKKCWSQTPQHRPHSSNVVDMLHIVSSSTSISCTSIM